MEEMNLDANNINIEIYADEIAKYNKGFKSRENAIEFTPVYFGDKKSKSVKRNSKFFPDETDDISEIKTNFMDDNEISKESSKKMNNFFQDSIHYKTTKRLMPISRDKKRIQFHHLPHTAECRYHPAPYQRESLSHP